MTTVLDNYKTILTNSKAEVRRIFLEAAKVISGDSQHQLPVQFIEKDFWVCLTLEILFNGGFTNDYKLLFKGGTALSKCNELIKRFSEDIDIVLFREDLGFEGDNDPTNRDIERGTNAQRRLFEELQKKSSEVINTQLKAFLEIQLAGLDCEVISDPADNQTLHIRYTSLFDALSYVKAEVKIEGGARSALIPHKFDKVKPYVSEVIADINFEVANVLAIDPKRTLLDKLMILHGHKCGYRDLMRTPPENNRYSRHYYDVAMLYKDPEIASAIRDVALMTDVRDANIHGFNQAWKKLEDATPEAIDIVPTGDLKDVIARDYVAMRGMIIGDAPSFDEILSIIEQIQIDIRPPQPSPKP